MNKDHVTLFCFTTNSRAALLAACRHESSNIIVYLIWVLPVHT